MSTLGPPGSVLGAAGATLGDLMGPEPPAPWAAFEGSSSSSGVDDGRAGLSGVGAVIVVGSSGFSSSSSGSANSESVLPGGIEFTLGASSVLELQHRCQTTRSTDGFGQAANLATEVFAELSLMKVG